MTFAPGIAPLVTPQTPPHDDALLFSPSPLIATLSWIVAIALGAKLVATIILLSVGKGMRDRPGWGAMLWWLTKITPVIAVPCAILIAWLQGLTGPLWLFVVLMLFVLVAVPLKIRGRRTRIARQATHAPS